MNAIQVELLRRYRDRATRASASGGRSCARSRGSRPRCATRARGQPGGRGVPPRRRASPLPAPARTRCPSRTRPRPGRRARPRRPPRSRPRSETTPTASRLAPSSTQRAARAGVDVRCRPRTGLPKRSQSLNAGLARARRRRSACRAARRRGSARARDSPCPPAITVGIPAAAASSAASTLLRIPPRPSAARLAERGVAARCALGEQLRARASRARASRRRRPPSAGRAAGRATRTATCAASASLSPKVISSVAVASFSFTTGTAPSANSASSALRALTYAARSATSRGREQHLGRVEAVARERVAPRPAAAAPGRARRRPGAARSAPRAALEAEPRQPERDRAGRDDADRLAARDDRARSRVARAAQHACAGRVPPGPATRLEPSLTTTVTGAACRRRRRGTGAARGRGT